MSAPALAGLRVLDLTRLLPGGYCTALLADLGADVLKVEDAGTGDYLRWAAPLHEGVERSAASAQFIALNRGKRSIQLDLKTREGRDALLDLAGRHDVLVEGFRPGVLDRLGVGWDALHARNPALVLCSITGYGQDGAHAARAGHDLDYLALTGLLDAQGEPAGPPVPGAAQVADLGGGALTAAFAILAAVRAAERDGEGQHVDVSMAHGALAWLTLPAAAELAGGEPAARGAGPLNGGFACYRVYACADGFVALGALEPKFWRAWCEGVGRADLAGHAFDPPGSETHAAVEELFAQRTREQWTAFAAEVECCLEPVVTLTEALASDLVAGRDMVVEVDQPGAGAPVRALDHPVRYSATRVDATRPAPALGEHTAEVLAELGYGAERIAALTR